MTFEPSVALTSFRLVSGNAEHPSDRFFNTTVEVRRFILFVVSVVVQIRLYQTIPGDVSWPREARVSAGGQF